MKNYKKVLVAMSGGVDSSVAAALLKKQGFEVAGIFLRLNNNYKNDEESARKVAEILGIPLKIADARKEFNKTVVRYFLNEYKSGRTPNPCAVCNPKIKFAQILKVADKLKIHYIATGHYSKVKSQKSQFKAGPPRAEKIKNESKKPKLIYELIKAKDKTKDQSYFLYGLNQKQLSRIIFPLGDYEKSEVKKIARKMNLGTADRRESHDVCFISGKAEDFIRKNLKIKKGKIIDEKGQVLGEHQGLPLYTIGQRKGMELGGIGPYYVIGKDVRKNKIIVSNNEKDSGLFQKEMLVGEVNWIKKPAKFPLKAKVKIRYGHPAVYATIKTHITKRVTRNKKYKIIFQEPQRAITPGQSAVFYTDKGEVLGGGRIIS